MNQAFQWYEILQGYTKLPSGNSLLKTYKNNTFEGKDVQFGYTLVLSKLFYEKFLHFNPCLLLQIRFQG